MLNRLFDPNNALFRTLSIVVDTVGLSLCWALLCIPIVTIGPATAALYYTVVKVFREGETNTFARFFRSFRSNLKPGVLCTLIFIPIALLLGLMGYWYGLAADNLGALGLLAYAYFYVMALLITAPLCWLFPLLGRFECSVRQLFATAFRLLIAHLPTTLLLLLLTAAAYVVIFNFFVLIFVVPTLWAFAASYPLERAFAKHMPREEEPPSDEDGDRD